MGKRGPRGKRRAQILQEYSSAIQAIAASRNGRDSALVSYGKSLPPKTLILTFDDGPQSPYTDRILETLNKFHVKSIFFELGENLGSKNKNSAKPSKAALASQHVLDSGSVLANQSYSHPLMTKLSDQEIADQLERTNRALQNVAKSSPSLFRPPYGAANEKLMAALEARQMKAVLWDIDSEDWADPIPKSIANRVLSSVDSEGRGIALDPNRAIAYVNLGDAYVALDRKEDARRSYETCIKLAPNTVFSQSASSKLAELNK